MPVYDDRYIKAKIGAYGDNVYTNFSGLNVPEDDIEYKSFTDFSIGYLRFYKNKFYLQVYLVSCTYKIGDKLINAIKSIYWKELTLLQVITVKNIKFVTTGFLVIGSNVKILSVMVAMI